MSMIEKCIVCKRKFNGVTNRSHYDLYHDALIALKKDKPLSKGFVCKECAHAAATVKCSVCGEIEHEFILSSVFSDIFARGLLSAERQYLSRAQHQLTDIGSSFRIDKNSVFVCDYCLMDAFNRARTNAIEKAGCPKSTNQMLWLNYGLVTDSKCCCRCGQEVYENFAKIFRAYVDFFFLPFKETSWIFAQEGITWDKVKKYLTGNQDKEWFSELEDAYLTKWFLSEKIVGEEEKRSEAEKRKHWYGQFRRIVAPFLKEKVLCRDCCAYLMSDAFRQNYFHMPKPKWMGWTKEGSVLGFSKQITFEKVIVEKKSESEFAHHLQDEARAVGANGAVNLKQTNANPVVDSNGRRVKVYDWSAVPVFLKREDAIDKIFGKVIVDGSNVVFAESGNLITGLATCLKALKLRKLKSFVFLDANIYHKLEDSENGVKQVKALKRLVESSKGEIVLVPAGARADDFILKKADTDGCHVLSNDRYKPYVERYPWIEQNRVHRFSFVDGRLMIPDFDIDVENK